jgi:hypothetical protein
MIELARHRAKRDGVEFALLIDDIVIPPICPILGIQLMVNDGVKGDNSPSVDRFNPMFGYIRDNVAVISHRANRIKNDATLEELRAVIRYMESHAKN